MQIRRSSLRARSNTSAVRGLVAAFLLTFGLLAAAPAHAQVGTPQFQCGGTAVGPVGKFNVTGGCCSYSGGTYTIACGGGGGGVTSISSGTGITLTPNPIVATGTVAVNQAASLTWTGNEAFTPASGVAITATGAAGANGYVYSGTAPASSGGAGTSCGSAFLITGAVGGATTGNATTAGNGEGGTWTAGGGGSAAGGTNANGGAGGSWLFLPGAGGAKSGAGAVGANGTLTVRAPSASFGSIFQVQSSTPTTNFYIKDDGSWYSTLVDSGVTAPGYIALAAGTSLAAMPGAGALSLSGMTGDSSFPTGEFTWNGDAGKNMHLHAQTGGAISLTSDHSADWITTTGDLRVDAAGVLNLGTSSATATQIAKAGIRNSQLGMVNFTVGGVLSVSGNAIAITANIHHVGAGLIKNITVPSTLTAGAALYVIPDAAFTYDNTGNLVVPAGGGTAVINKLMIFVFDGSKWTPSY